MLSIIISVGVGQIGRPFLFGYARLYHTCGTGTSFFGSCRGIQQQRYCTVRYSTRVALLLGQALGQAGQRTKNIMSTGTSTVPYRICAIFVLVPVRLKLGTENCVIADCRRDDKSRKKKREHPRPAPDSRRSHLTAHNRTTRSTVTDIGDLNTKHKASREPTFPQNLGESRCTTLTFITRTTMKVLALAATVGLGAAGLAGFCAARLGVFSKVTWTKGAMEGFKFAYVDHSGPYNEIGPRYAELHKLLESEAGIKVGFKTHRSVGIFYDNPETTPAKDLKSVAGTILSEEEVGLAKKAGIKIKTVESQKEGLVATFPLQSFLSILVGVFKAYPSLTAFCKETGAEHAECAEIYDWANKKITYFAFKK